MNKHTNPARARRIVREAFQRKLRDLLAGERWAFWRRAILATNERFGLARASELSPEKIPDYLEALGTYRENSNDDNTATDRSGLQGGGGDGSCA